MAKDPLSTELRGVSMRLSRRLRAERADQDITDGQYTVLGYLFKRESCTPKELAEREHVTPPSMNRTINALERSGYATRTPSDSDGRKVLVAITDAGRQLVIDTRLRRDTWLQSRLRTLTPAQRRVLEEATVILQEVLDPATTASGQRPAERPAAERPAGDRPPAERRK
jgi:DNA-binding MarR family transcriptional regulator